MPLPNKKLRRNTLVMDNTTQNQPCREAYERQKMARQNYPLYKGRYKLREAQAALDKMLYSFDNIVDYQHRVPKPVYENEELGGFLAWETPDRMRQIPTKHNNYNRASRKSPYRLTGPPCVQLALNLFASPDSPRRLHPSAGLYP